MNVDPFFFVDQSLCTKSLISFSFILKSLRLVSILMSRFHTILNSSLGSEWFTSPSKLKIHQAPCGEINFFFFFFRYRKVSLFIPRCFSHIRNCLILPSVSRDRIEKIYQEDIVTSFHGDVSICSRTLRW